MKIGVSSYSFSSLINKGEITQKDTVRLAKEIGFDAIEFTELKPDGDKSIEEYAKEIKNEAENYGMECFSCGCCSYSCPAKRPLTQLITAARAHCLQLRKNAQGGK